MVKVLVFPTFSHSCVGKPASTMVVHVFPVRASRWSPGLGLFIRKKLVSSGRNWFVPEETGRIEFLLEETTCKIPE